MNLSGRTRAILNVAGGLSFEDVSRDGRVAAQWTTTGAVVHPEPSARLAGLRAARHRNTAQLRSRPLWQQIAILYGAVTLIVLAGVALGPLRATIRLWLGAFETPSRSPLPPLPKLQIDSTG